MEIGRNKTVLHQRKPNMTPPDCHHALDTCEMQLSAETQQEVQGGALEKETSDVRVTSFDEVGLDDAPKRPRIPCRKNGYEWKPQSTETLCVITFAP